MNQNDKKKTEKSTVVQRKRYYRIEFCLASAMSIGSGQNNLTDKDIIRNSRGEPYIPGTSLAGIYRTFFINPDKYFGSIKKSDTGGNASIYGSQQQTNASEIITYDACLLTEDIKISNRDCVGLDWYKTGIPGAKFDFEVLEPGAKFVTYLEQNEYGSDESLDWQKLDEESNRVEKAGDTIAAAWMDRRIVIGAKGSRGLGQIKDVKVYKKEFNFNNPSDIDAWIKFDIYDKSHWGEEFVVEKADALDKWEKNVLHLSILLEQESPLTVRTYTTDVRDDKDDGKAVPDYKQTAYIRSDEEIPFIPGTSWAGAFRHHMEKMIQDQKALKKLFGFKSENNGKMTGQKSAIVFCESEIQHAESKTVTRNAIDRFSGGTVDGALFTEKSCVGGKTSLEIQILEGNISEECMKALAASIVDLGLGFLAIGGETSIGHGLFSIKGIYFNDCAENLKEEEPEDTYQNLVDALSGNN